MFGFPNRMFEWLFRDNSLGRRDYGRDRASDNFPIASITLFDGPDELPPSQPGFYIFLRT
jgi:hypothetical protein